MKTKSASSIFALIKPLHDALSSSNISISKMGYFGSSVHNDDVRDIDVLLTIHPDARIDTETYSDLISTVVKRIEGDYSLDAPIDPFLKDSGPRCLKIIMAKAKFPVVHGLGPANLHNHQGRWIHLNGPITDAFWKIFADRFPIHAWIIRNNYIPLCGGLPHAPPFTGHEILKYCHEMESRTQVRPSIAYVDKLLKVLGLLAGERSCVTIKAIEAVFGGNSPFARLFEQLSKGTKQNVADISFSLIDLIRGYANAMLSFNLQYPTDWMSI